MSDEGGEVPRAADRSACLGTGLANRASFDPGRPTQQPIDDCRGIFLCSPCGRGRLLSRDRGSLGDWGWCRLSFPLGRSLDPRRRAGAFLGPHAHSGRPQRGFLRRCRGSRLRRVLAHCSEVPRLRVADFLRNLWGRDVTGRRCRHVCRYHGRNGRPRRVLFGAERPFRCRNAERRWWGGCLQRRPRGPEHPQPDDGHCDEQRGGDPDLPSEARTCRLGGRAVQARPNPRRERPDRAPSLARLFCQYLVRGKFTQVLIDDVPDVPRAFLWLLFQACLTRNSSAGGIPRRNVLNGTGTS
jgi:hypothetical protein